MNEKSTNFERLRRLLPVIAGCGLVVCTTRGVAAEIKPAHPGERIYREMCAECHGKKGEGVVGKRGEPLVGNRNVAALAKYIAKSMPEDKEGTCIVCGRPSKRKVYFARAY